MKFQNAVKQILIIFFVNHARKQIIHNAKCVMKVYQLILVKLIVILKKMEKMSKNVILTVKCMQILSLFYRIMYVFL